MKHNESFNFGNSHKQLETSKVVHFISLSFIDDDHYSIAIKFVVRLSQFKLAKTKIITKTSGVNHRSGALQTIGETKAQAAFGGNNSMDMREIHLKIPNTGHILALRFAHFPHGHRSVDCRGPAAGCPLTRRSRPECVLRI